MMKPKLHDMASLEILQAVAVTMEGALCSLRMKKNYVSTFYFWPYKFLIFFGSYLRKI